MAPFDIHQSAIVSIAVSCVINIELLVENYRDFEMQVSGHSPHEFMHDLYIAEIYKPETIFCPLTVWITSFAFTQQAAEKLYIVRRCVTVIKDHRNDYKSKARMRLAISLPL